MADLYISQRGECRRLAVSQNSCLCGPINNRCTVFAIRRVRSPRRVEAELRGEVRKLR